MSLTISPIILTESKPIGDGTGSIDCSGYYRRPWQELSILIARAIDVNDAVTDYSESADSYRCYRLFRRSYQKVQSLVSVVSASSQDFLLTQLSADGENHLTTGSTQKAQRRGIPLSRDG